MSADLAYAKCLDCGLELPTLDAAREHCRSTMAPTDEAGVTARSHTYTVVNPTPEEQASRRARSVVSSAIESATERAFDDLDSAIRRGDASEEEVSRELASYPDFADGWDEWRAEGDR